MGKNFRGRTWVCGVGIVFSNQLALSGGRALAGWLHWFLVHFLSPIRMCWLKRAGKIGAVIHGSGTNVFWHDSFAVTWDFS